MTALVTTISQPASLQLVVNPPAEIKTTFEIGQGPAGARGLQGLSGTLPNLLMVQVTAEHILSKSLTLPSVPLNEVFANIVGGTAQKQNVDFIVTGSVVSWESLSLELLLEAGDYLSIFYI
jgi:hypothetical protein